MELFDDHRRTDSRPSGHSESQWHFFDRVAGAYWDQVRDLLAGWFDNLRDDETQKSIRGRMRSGDNADFRSAFAELYVHETLIRSGYAVTYEPSIPGSSRRPDFLAERENDSLIVEVTTRATLENDRAGAKREAALHDALNSTPTENFFLDFDVDARGPGDIGARPLKKALVTWMKTLDPDAVATSLSNHEYDAVPKFNFSRDGWEIVFRAFPVAKDRRGPDSNRRAIGMSGGGVRVVNDREIIRKALSDKTHAYGSLDRPFVIALALDTFDRDEETEAALYGGPTVELAVAPDGSWVQSAGREADGYWTRPDAVGRSQVSGLLILPGSPLGIAKSSPTLWSHPNPDREVPTLPSWAKMRVVGGLLERSDAQIQPWQFFGLEEDWPVGVAFGDNA